MTERIDLPSDAAAAERQRLLPDALRLGPVRLRVSDLLTGSSAEAVVRLE